MFRPSEIRPGDEGLALACLFFAGAGLYGPPDEEGFGRQMAGHHVTPHFHNQPGARRVCVGVREFMCIGALPPFDHPHIFIDMGDATETVCEYCSTLFVYDAALGPHADPAACEYHPEAA